MTGLEKIIQKIEDDCELECAGIIKKADDEAKLILEKAQVASEEVRQNIIKAADSQCIINIELANSKADLERKKNILSAKINIVNKVIENAMNKLKSLPDSEYFHAIELLIKRYAKKGCGTLRLSKRDLDRLPDNFEVHINQILKESGAYVQISREAINIDNGFILVYEDIEQNCTFDALLASTIDDIKDELNEVLFTRDSL